MDSWNLTSEELSYVMKVARRAADALCDENGVHPHCGYATYWCACYDECYKRSLEWAVECRKVGITFMPEPQGWGFSAP